jgi:riboflavin biosynthesis pyrimidine reductase
MSLIVAIVADRGGLRTCGMRRLLPEPADDVSVEGAYAAPLGSHPDRPWVGLCMVASIDGSAVFEGTSGGLSNPTDAAVLGQLRRIADVVIVGAGTVRDEGYGAPQKTGQRIGVVTRSADVDLSGELFASGAGFLITSEGTEVPSRSVDVLRAGRDEVDLAAAIRRLDEVSEVCRFVQAEGGPALNGALLEDDLLDELNVTTSATTVGGSGPRLATGADHRRDRYELRQLAIDEQSFLYARWLRRRR